MASQHGATGMAEQATGMQNQHYNLVSILYHALQGGETIQQYIQDAQQEGDQELRQFFDEVQDCQRHLATRAQEMLSQRLNRGNGHTASTGQTRRAHNHSGRA
jgi:hypothetical protein